MKELESHVNMQLYNLPILFSNLNNDYLSIIIK